MEALLYHRYLIFRSNNLIAYQDSMTAISMLACIQLSSWKPDTLFVSISQVSIEIHSIERVYYCLYARYLNQAMTLN
jgi:hypothetical protein